MGPNPLSEDPRATVAWLVRVAVATAGLQLLLRLALLGVSPLVPASPAAWLALGTCEDVAVLGLAAGALALLLRAAVPPRVVRWVFGSLVLLQLASHLAWAELIAYFGHPPRREDLVVGAGGSFVAKSVSLAGAVRPALFAVVAVAVMLAAARRRTAGGARGLRVLVGAAVLAAAIAALPLRTHLRETARTPLLAAADLLRSRDVPWVGKSVSVPPPRSPVASVRSLLPRQLRPLGSDPEYPLATRVPARSPSAPSLPAGPPPNVVFLVMEGVRAHEVGCYGGSVPGLTPNLDALAREGILFRDAWCAGTHSPDGELGIWYALLPVPHEVLMTEKPFTKLTGFPEILRAHGWRSFLWVHNSDQTFYRETQFYQPRGIRTVDGRDFAPTDPGTNWGKSDRVLMERAAGLLDRLPEPFAAMVLTISNHHPFQVPPDATSPAPPVPQKERRGFRVIPGLQRLMGLHTVPMLRTIHYTDEAVGHFFDLARRSPWFSRTIFVLTSDHGIPVMPLEGTPTRHEFAGLRHRVPLILFAPGLLPHGLVMPLPASHVDVLPTILGLLGIDSPRPGPGADLLDPAERDPDRPVISWDDEARTVTVTTEAWSYHGTLPPGVTWSPAALTDEQLVDRARDGAGRVNAASANRAVVERLRGAALAYLDAYPWLVSTGRSGLPPGTLTRTSS